MHVRCLGSSSEAPFLPSDSYVIVVWTRLGLFVSFVRHGSTQRVGLMVVPSDCVCDAHHNGQDEVERQDAVLRQEEAKERSDEHNLYKKMFATAPAAPAHAPTNASAKRGPPSPTEGDSASTTAEGETHHETSGARKDSPMAAERTNRTKHVVTRAVAVRGEDGREIVAIERQVSPESFAAKEAEAAREEEDRAAQQHARTKHLLRSAREASEFTLRDPKVPS